MCISYTRIFLTILCIFLFGNSFAQNPSTPAAKTIEKALLSGTLLGQDGQEPLPFATVAIYDRSDSTMVSNTLSEVDGTFSLNLSAGKYYAEISYIGFEDKIIPDITVEESQSTLELGTVIMKSDAVSLQEIEVRAERSQMEFKLDRRVFNVGKDLTNAGNSAADILDNVPSRRPRRQR